MMPGTEDFPWLRLILAFSVVFGLMAALGYVLKYVSLRGLSLPSKTMRARRLGIVETLALDTRRRLVIVRCDGQEHLLLLSAQSDIVVQSNLPSSPVPPAS